MALVKGVEQVWDGGQVPLNVCVIRYWNGKKQKTDPIILVTTAQTLNEKWIARYDEDRPEVEHDCEQMKSGGWHLKKLSSTRYSEIVCYILTVMLSYSRYHLFANTQAGAQLAEKRREALAFEPFRSHRTPVIVNARDYFEIFETLSVVQLVLRLPTEAQDRRRHWLDNHLHTVAQREGPVRNGGVGQQKFKLIIAGNKKRTPQPHGEPVAVEGLSDGICQRRGFVIRLA